MLKKTTMLAAAGVGAFALAAVATQNLTGEIKIAGSSTVGPVTIAVAEQFRDQHPDVEVSNSITGTGGGFKRFTVGETDISNASRPIKYSEMQAAEANGIEYIEIPVAYDGLTFAVNTDNYWVNEMSVQQLRQIFADGSTVQTWRDLNPQWPNTEIKMFIPGTDSGTFDYFKEVVLGDDGNVRGDVTVSEDDNVLVNGIANEPGAIGFFGAAYYFENQDKLKSLAIINEAGKAVKPTNETISSGEYNPFSRPLFIYVNADSANKPVVKEFVRFYLSNAAKISEEVGYVGLPRSVYYRAMQKFNKGETGTHFHTEDGEKREGSVVELYR
jgi:phosphate transport system substrate-binding protein